MTRVSIDILSKLFRHFVSIFVFPADGGYYVLWMRACVFVYVCFLHPEGVHWLRQGTQPNCQVLSDFWKHFRVRKVFLTDWCTQLWLISNR